MWDGIDRASGSSRKTPAAEDTTVVAATPLVPLHFQLMKFLNYLKLKMQLKKDDSKSNCR
jgi:hypothetical protein